MAVLLLLLLLCVLFIVLSYLCMYVVPFLLLATSLLTHDKKLNCMEFYYIQNKIRPYNAAMRISNLALLWDYLMPGSKIVPKSFELTTEHTRMYNLLAMYHTKCVNLLNPTGHVMHQQFNIQQLYVLPTVYLCVLYLSENKERLVSLTAKTDWFL